MTKKTTQKVPELRFPEFKGEWENFKLDNIAKIITGSTPSTFIKEYYGGNKLFVSPADLSSNRFINETKTTLTDLGFSKGRKVPKGSVLFVCIGSTIGKVGQANEECVTNQQINSLSAILSFDNNFIYSVLEKNGSKIKLLAGVQAVPQINKSDFSAFKYYFPTLAEQQKIATFLTAVDKNISLITQKKTLLEQYKKGVMQKIFNQEIRFQPNSQEEQLAQAAEPTAAYGNNHYPNWEVKKLGEIATITTGSSNREDSSLVGEFTFFDRSQDIRTSDRYLFDKEAIIFPGEGQKFVPKYFIGKFDLHQRAYAIFDFIDINGLYLYHLLNWSDRHLQSHAVGSTVKSLRLPMFKKMPIKVPCLEEQQKIAAFLSALDDKIENAQTQIDHYTTWKKGLLQKLFV